MSDACHTMTVEWSGVLMSLKLHSWSLVSFSNVVLPIDLRLAEVAEMAGAVEMSNNSATLTVMPFLWQLQPPRWELALMENPNLPFCLAVSGWCLGRPGKSASKVRAWRWWPHGRICDFLCGIFTPGTKWQLEDSLRNFIHRLRAKKLLSFTSGTPDVTEVAPSLSTGRAMYYGLATMHHLKNENNQNCPSQS